MKNLYLIIFLFIGIAASAQAPDKMSYQAVIRDASGALLKNQDVTIQFSIIQTSPAGTIVYREDHRATTNSNGLASIYIGTGNIAIGSFSTIDWASGPYFLQTDIDPLAGASYVISSTTELVSVPYALHANVADSLIGGVNETDPVFNGSIAKGISATDTAYWNGMLDGYTETDPVFDASIAKGISTTDTAYWNGKLDGYTETDPVFNQSVASSITAGDTAAWNNHLSADFDTDTTNEIQTISLVNDTIRLNNGGGYIPITFIKSYLDSLNGNKSPITKYRGNYNDTGTNVGITFKCSGTSTPVPAIRNTRYLDTFSLKAGDFLQIKGASVCAPKFQTSYCYAEKSRVYLQDSAGNLLSIFGIGYSGCTDPSDIIYIIPNDGDYILVNITEYRSPVTPSILGIRGAYIFIN